MTTPLLAPDDDDTYVRVGSVLASPADVWTPILLLAPPFVSPENFTAYTNPRGFGYA